MDGVGQPLHQLYLLFHSATNCEHEDSPHQSSMADHQLHTPNQAPVTLTIVLLSSHLGALSEPELRRTYDIRLCATDTLLSTRQREGDRPIQAALIEPARSGVIAARTSTHGGRARSLAIVTPFAPVRTPSEKSSCACNQL